MDLMKKGVSGILKLIATIIVVVAVALALIFGYNMLQLFIFARGDYLLFVANGLSFLPIMIILFLIEYNYYNIKEKNTNKKKNKEVQAPKPSKARRIVKLIYATVIIGFIYIGITSYSILYKDSIKVASATKPAGIIYKYNDINKVKVGVKRIFDGSYSVYYKVIFNNGDKAELFYGSMFEEKGGRHEEILEKLDEQLKEQGVEKEANKKNFDKYASGLDKDFVSKVEKLFD